VNLALAKPTPGGLYTAQLNHQTYLANHYATRLEEEERKSQEHIQRTIALSTRLDETKKWVRKLKKAVLQEKEKALPMYNEALANRIELRQLEERRQEEFKRQCDAFLEQQAALAHECHLKAEKIEALEAMVSALSHEYSQRLTEMIARDDAWRALMANLAPVNGAAGQPGWPQAMLQFAKDEGADGAADLDPRQAGGYVTAMHMQLRLENEVLRSNVQGVMHVVDHCYEENTRLANLTARLTRSLTGGNPAAGDWQRGGPATTGGWGSDEDGRWQRKEEKYLKQIANLHFTVVRLKQQLQEMGIESQADAAAMGEEEEEDSGTECDEAAFPT